MLPLQILFWQNWDAPPEDYDRFIIAMSTMGVDAAPPTQQAIAYCEMRSTKHSCLNIGKL
ncbi:hypothetical protein [Nostoc sp.]|uniref:hypothetical protein n=1 Tax=Nostoc sp. TaxID=1180 RepID=UPI002FFB2A99